MAKKLFSLNGYEIVFICDDSGSMNNPLGKIFHIFLCVLMLRNFLQVMLLVLIILYLLVVRLFSFEFDQLSLYLSQGDELKQTVSIVVDLASILDPNGVDVYFLNREPILNVRNSSELIPVFAVPPEGMIN